MLDYPSGFPTKKHVSHEKKTKKLRLSIESWLVNRDPYFMVYEIISIYNWVVYKSPIYHQQPPGKQPLLLNLLI